MELTAEMQQARKPRWKRVLRFVLWALLALIITLLGAWYYFWYSPTPFEPSLSSRVTKNAIKVGDRTRSYLAYTPAGLPRSRSLVIVLHGSAMDAATMRRWTGYEFDRLADKRGFAVLYPDGYQGNWNDCRKDATFAAKRENVDDIGFPKALIDTSVRRFGIDRRQVYLFGYSNGGHLAFRVALDHPGMAAAVVAAGASLPVSSSSSCRAQGPTAPIMLVDGTEDPINPFAGGKVTLFGFGSRGFALSAEQSALTLAQRNGLSAQATRLRLPAVSADDPTWVDRRIWRRDGRPYIILDAVNGGGHIVPQRTFRFPRLLGRTTSAVDAPRAAIDFYRSASAHRFLGR